METEAQKFATWKFKWVDALLIGVEGKELRIALYLLQRCNAESGLINPSMRNIAHMLNIDVRTVERAVDRLEAAGILSTERDRRQESYRYHFNDEWMQSSSEVELALRTEWQGRRWRKEDPSKLSGRGTKTAPSTAG